LSRTWAGHAFSILDQKQGAMGRALDQAVAGIQELVGGPFQPDTSVRAAIDIDMNLTAPAHGKQLLAVNIEPAAAGIDQLQAWAKKLHVYPLISTWVIGNVCT
jgi:hypothetical protein